MCDHYRTDARVAAEGEGLNDGNALAALGTTGVEHGTATCRFHARAKAMRALAAKN